jgi:hypothetical protein
VAVSTVVPRPTFAVQTIADHWGITSFTVHTPQNGDDNSLEVTAESWTGVPGLDRGFVATLKTATFTPAQIAPLLAAAGAVYEAARAQQVNAADAMYLALKVTLERALQAQGIFPNDAQ